MLRKVIFEKLLTCDLKYDEKKTVWTAPTKCDVTPQTNKENKFTKDYLSNQYSIEPNSPATDLNFFVKCGLYPEKGSKKKTVLDKKAILRI